MAIEAAVFRAELAGLLEAFAQLAPGAMQTHLQIVARDADLLRDHLRGLTVEVGQLEHLCIFRPHRRQQTAKTRAGRLFEVALLVATDRQLFRKALHRLCLSRAAAMQVGEDIAQDAIKPGKQVFVVRERMLAFQGAQQAFLNGIGRELIVAKSSSGEALESGEIGEQSGSKRVSELGFRRRHEIDHSTNANARRGKGLQCLARVSHYAAEPGEQVANSGCRA